MKESCEGFIVGKLKQYGGKISYHKAMPTIGELTAHVITFEDGVMLRVIAPETFSPPFGREVTLTSVAYGNNSFLYMEVE